MTRSAMRIVLTVNYSPWSAYCGGGQRSTHALATALVARGHRVTVVYTKPPWEAVSPPDEPPYEVRWAAFVGLRSWAGAPLRPLNAAPVARAVRGLLTADDVTIVHSQGEEGALVPRLRRRHPDRLRFVVTARYPRFPDALLRPVVGPASRVRRALIPPKFHALGMALRGADQRCVTSEATRRDLCRAFQLEPETVRVVPNGVAPAFLEARRSPGAARGPILFFGRISRSKGLHTLLDAMVRIGADAPDLVVVGRGPEERSLRARAEAAGIGPRVRWAGWMDPPALAQLLAGARLAVLPSLEESFGNAMVEAMAAGVPTITTRVGSLPEVVGDPPCAVLVPPGDPDRLAEAMATLLRDPRAAEALGHAGRAHVTDRYSWDATARRYEDLYDGLVAP